MYNKIGQREFEDTILFKHHKRKKRRPQISASVTSLSSSGSDEKDSAIYTTHQSTLMNLSTVGVLPDLRSPESIKNDIEYKEKILANVLNFDKVEELQEEATPQIVVQQKEEEVSIADEKEEIVLEEAQIPVEEFSIKPFKHILPEFDQLKAPGK